VKDIGLRNGRVTPSDGLLVMCKKHNLSYNVLGLEPGFSSVEDQPGWDDPRKRSPKAF
jgi:hypothetical protein